MPEPFHFLFEIFVVLALVVAGEDRVSALEVTAERVRRIRVERLPAKLS